MKFCSVYLEPGLLGEYKFRIVTALSELNIFSLGRDSISSNDFASKSNLFNAHSSTVGFLE